MTAGNRVVVPPVHLVTDDAVLARADFGARVTELLALGGDRLAIHLRGPGTPGRRLEALARTALDAAAGGGWVIVNDRLDVGLAVGADGVQLAGHSLPLDAARGLAPAMRLGVSVHGAGEVGRELDPDWFVAGTIWETASHPGRPGGGLDHLRAIVARTDRPVVAIGGVTPERVAGARRAGAAGVAVLRGIWADADPARALSRYLSAWSDR